MTSRERQAQRDFCVVCIATKPEAEAARGKNLCGAWINDSTGATVGRECARPLCAGHAEIRGNVWLCPDHDGKPNLLRLGGAA